MRVLTTLTYYHPHWTGLTRYAQAIAEGLVERGHQVTVLTTRHDRGLPEREVLAGVDIVRLAVAGRVSRTMVMPTFPARLWQLLGAHDVLHVHSPMAEAALATTVARARGVPTVITHQGDVVMPAGVGNRVVQGAMTANLAAAARLASGVTTLSADYAAHSWLLSGVADKVWAIAPPTSIPSPDAAAVARLRAIHSLGAGPVVGFAGRFVEEKGFDVLLRAVPYVRAAVPDVHFVFAGATEVVYERFFERCAPDFAAEGGAVRSLGLLTDRQAMANFYGLCDLFVLPSRSDCFGAVQVEALLCGTPVVATDIPGAREVVRRTGGGALVPPGDVAALSQAIVGMLRRPIDRPRRADIESVYDAHRSLDEHEAALARAARRDRGPTEVASARRPTPEAPIHSPGAPTRSPEPPTLLAARDRQLLDRCLEREADMAVRRRSPFLVESLGLRDGDRVLDVGCGLGFHLRLLHQLRPLELVGVDVDPERLERARGEAPMATLVLADAAALPLDSGSFDSALVSEVLEHVTDDLALLREVRRVVRPGGSVAVSVPHAHYPFWWDPVNRVREALGVAPCTSPVLFAGQWTGHRRLYLPSQLRALGEAAGLRVEAVEELTSVSVPFNHALVYGIGRPLVERGVLPSSWRAAATRFDPGPAAASTATRLMSTACSALRWVDRRNDRPRRRPPTRFVSLVARLRVPEDGATVGRGRP